MIDIDEKQADEILDFLAIRFARCNNLYPESNLCLDNSDCYVFLGRKSYYVYANYKSYALCAMSSDARKCYELQAGTMKYRYALQDMLEWVSKGYAIETFDFDHFVFMHPFETLESILIEKDLEESIS